MNPINEGDIISVTLLGYEGYKWKYHITKVDLLQYNEYERIKLSILEEIQPNTKTKEYEIGEKIISVEPNWFTHNPKRIINFEECTRK